MLLPLGEPPERLEWRAVGNQLEVSPSRFYVPDIGVNADDCFHARRAEAAASVGGEARSAYLGGRDCEIAFPARSSGLTT